MTKRPAHRPTKYDTAMTAVIRARVPAELAEWVKARGNQAAVIREAVALMKNIDRFARLCREYPNEPAENLLEQVTQ